MKQHIDLSLRPSAKTQQHVTKPYPGLVNNVPQPTRAQPPKPRLISDINRTRPIPRPRPVVATPPADLPRPAHAAASAATAPHKRHRFRGKIQTFVIVLAAIAASFMLQSLVTGEIVIAGYAVFALVGRVPSRTTFLLACLSLLGVAGLGLFGNNDTVASNFTVYTFLLLSVGALSLARELIAAR